MTDDLDDFFEDLSNINIEGEPLSPETEAMFERLRKGLEEKNRRDEQRRVTTFYLPPLSQTNLNERMKCRNIECKYFGGSWYPHYSFCPYCGHKLWKEQPT